MGGCAGEEKVSVIPRIGGRSAGVFASTGADGPASRDCGSGKSVGVRGVLGSAREVRGESRVTVAEEPARPKSIRVSSRIGEGE